MISAKSLAVTCRAMSTLLDTGIAVDKAFELAAAKLPDRKARSILLDVQTQIQRGHDVESSMRAQPDAFPELMIDMVTVAEQTGHLPEVLRALSEHFENNLRLRRTFISAITWPLLQFFAAVMVIALLILILGLIGESGAGQTVDVLGWGLLGVSGALTWLGGVGLFCSGLFVLYQAFRRSLKWRKLLDPYLLKVPVIGRTLQSFAIARFSWAFALTQQAGMTLAPSLKSSLRATSNGAFISSGRTIWDRLRSGETFSAALDASGLFPEDFIHMVAASENAGTVPEALHRLSPQFEDEARRNLLGLVRVLGWLIWLAVAGFIIFIVFSMAMWYMGLLNDAVNEALR